MPDDERYLFLLTQATNALRRATDARVLAAAGITSAQAGALFAIRAGDRPSQRELGRTLGLGEPAVTGLVGRLEQRGLVVREADSEDRRTWRLSLSPAGRRALAAIEPERRALNAEVVRLLGDDADRVVAALRRLAGIDRPAPTGTRP